MNRAPLRLRPPPPAILAQLKQIERRFHERAFGEELARANLDMSLIERRAYLEWMRHLGRRHGVRLREGAASSWLSGVAEEAYS
jgi:hypothetical protein